MKQMKLNSAEVEPNTLVALHSKIIDRLDLDNTRLFPFATIWSGEEFQYVGEADQADILCKKFGSTKTHKELVQVPHQGKLVPTNANWESIKIQHLIQKGGNIPRMPMGKLNEYFSYSSESMIPELKEHEKMLILEANFDPRVDLYQKWLIQNRERDQIFGIFFLICKKDDEQLFNDQQNYNSIFELLPSYFKGIKV